MNLASSSSRFAVVFAAIVWSIVAVARSPQRFTDAFDGALLSRLAEAESDDATGELRAMIAREVAGMRKQQARLERELVAASRLGWGLAFRSPDAREARRVPWEITATTGGGLTRQPFDLTESFVPRVDDVAVATWTANAGYVPTLIAFPPNADGRRHAVVGVRRIQFRAFPSAEGVWPKEITRGALVELQGTSIRRVGMSPFATVSELVGRPSENAVDVVTYGPYFDVIRAEDEACFESGSAAYIVRGPRVLASIGFDGRVVTNTDRGRRFVAQECAAYTGSWRRRRGWLSDVALELACRRLLGEPTDKLLVEVVEPELRRPRCVDASFLRDWAAMPTLSDE